jgi:hypothetical protein
MQVIISTPYNISINNKEMLEALAITYLVDTKDVEYIYLIDPQLVLGYKIVLPNNLVIDNNFQHLILGEFDKINQLICQY